MLRSHEKLQCFGAPASAIVALGLVACTSGSSSDATPKTCTSPPAVSRPIAYPPARQTNRETWAFLIAHIGRQPGVYSEYQFGFTDPGGIEHLSAPADTAKLARYPDRSPDGRPKGYNVIYKIGRGATTLTIYGITRDGSAACYTPPAVQFGVHGNLDQVGPIGLQPPTEPPVGDYYPVWPPKEQGAVTPSFSPEPSHLPTGQPRAILAAA